MKALLCVFAAAMAAPVLAQPATAPTTAPAPRPTSDFARLPFMEGPELSPAGTHVAAKVNGGGRQVLAILNLFDKTKPVTISLGENDLLSWSWVNDEWLVLRVANVVRVETEDFFVTRLVGVAASGAKLVPIAFKSNGQSADVLWTASDGTPRIIMSKQDSIYFGPDFWPDIDEVNVSTGRSKQLVDGRVDFMRWFVDPVGAVRMGVGYDDTTRKAKLLYRPDPKADFRILDRANYKNDEGLTFPILLAGQSTQALTVSDKGGFDALYDLNLETMEIGKKVFDVAGYDVGAAILNPAGTSLAGVRYTAGSGRTHWIDPELKAVQDMLDKAVGANRRAHIASLSRDQKRMIVWVGDPSQPGSYYFFDAGAGGAMNRFAYVNEAIKAPLGPVSTFRYKARDSLSIEAVLTLPKGRDAKNLPLILMPHGGPEARDDASYDWWAQFLADRGYAVVQPNYRGSTGYGRDFLNAGDGQWGLKMQDDLNDAVVDLAGKGMIDPKRVCIMGASYGGYAAMRGAQRDGAKFRCAISYAGVSDINGMLKYDSRFLNGNSARAGWREAAPDLKDVSPINHASDYSTPILVMHGKKDLRVPVAQSRRMVDRLKAAGKPVEYIEQPEGDHYFSRQADRQQFLEAVEAFLKKHNPA